MTMSTDTRPYERIQDSFKHYGRFILERYGKDAYSHWLREKYKKYRGETRSCLIDIDENGSIIPAQRWAK